MVCRHCVGELARGLDLHARASRGRAGSSDARSSRATRSAARAPRRARRRRAPRRRRPRSVLGCGARCGGRADHERDLALRRLGEARGDLGGAGRARPPRSASSARGRRPPGALGIDAAARLARLAGSRLGDSNATAGQRQPASSSQSRASASAAARQVAEERVALADEAARDERRLDRRGPGEHRDREPVLERRRDQARARVVDARQPGVAREREPLARLQAGQDLGRARGLVVPVEARRAARATRAGRGGRASAACPRRGRRRPRRARAARAASRPRGSRSGSGRRRAAD